MSSRHTKYIELTDEPFPDTNWAWPSISVWTYASLTTEKQLTWTLLYIMVTGWSCSLAWEPAWMKTCFLGEMPQMHYVRSAIESSQIMQNVPKTFLVRTSNEFFCLFCSAINNYYFHLSLSSPYQSIQGTWYVVVRQSPENEDKCSPNHHEYSCPEACPWLLPSVTSKIWELHVASWDARTSPFPGRLAASHPGQLALPPGSTSTGESWANLSLNRSVPSLSHDKY
jgi:hypothetical protein